MSITVFGSVNVDLTAYVERLPRPGATSHATNFATGLGGKGAKQVVAAQRLSRSPVRFVAPLSLCVFLNGKSQLTVRMC